MASVRMRSRWTLVVAATLTLSLFGACTSDEGASPVNGLGDLVDSGPTGSEIQGGSDTTFGVDDSGAGGREGAEAAAYRLFLAGLGCDDLGLGTFELIPGAPLTGGQCTLAGGQTIYFVQFADAEEQTMWTRAVHDAFAQSQGADCRETVVLTGSGWMISAPLAELAPDDAARLRLAAGGDLDVLAC